MIVHSTLVANVTDIGGDIERMIHHHVFNVTYATGPPQSASAGQDDDRCQKDTPVRSGNEYARNKMATARKLYLTMIDYTIPLAI